MCYYLWIFKGKLFHKSCFNKWYQLLRAQRSKDTSDSKGLNDLPREDDKRTSKICFSSSPKFIAISDHQWSIFQQVWRSGITTGISFSANIREIIKLTQIYVIYSSHTHVSNPVLIEMLRGYNIVKERFSEFWRKYKGISLTWYWANGIFKYCTTPLIGICVENHPYAQKQIWRKLWESFCAAGIIIADKYKVTVKGEPFLLFDSGFGDVNRIIIFANP